MARIILGKQYLTMIQGMIVIKGMYNGAISCFRFFNETYYWYGFGMFRFCCFLLVDALIDDKLFTLVLLRYYRLDFLIIKKF